MRRALEQMGAKKPREGRAPAPSFSNAPMSSRNSIDGQKRRFVRDGEVPVMMVSGSRPPEGQSQRRAAGPVSDQIEAVQMALRAERAGHEAADRALREAQTTIQDLRTKLGHVALARDEAIETAKRAEMARAALANELDTINGRLAAEVSARARAERMVAQLAPPEPEIVHEPVVLVAPQVAPRRRGRPPKSAAAAAPPADETDTPALPRRRGRPPKDKSLDAAEAPKRKPGRPRIEREPEPVKWWLPKGARSKAV
jgi:hypothetical protein